MKNLILVLTLVVMLFLVFITGAKAEAPPAEWYLQYQPNIDVFHELERGRVDFYVTKATPVYYKVYNPGTIAYWDELIKGEVLPAGALFHVDGISGMYEGYRWVRGWYGNEHIGGKSYLFPAENLSFEYVVDSKPNIPGKTDCTGHPLAVDWFRTGKINWILKLPKDADKIDIFLAEDYWLVDTNLFGAEQRRACLVSLKKNTVVSFQGNLVDNDWTNPITGNPDPASGTRWARVRLPGGMEGLVPTGKLSLTPAAQDPPATAASGGRASLTLATSTYVVKPGDTLWGIGIKYGAGVEELVTVNAKTHPSLVSNPGSIRPGWAITIPSGN